MSKVIKNKYVHKRTGHVYLILDGKAMMKHPDTGEWIEGVCYRKAPGTGDGRRYFRTRDSFDLSFTQDNS